MKDLKVKNLLLGHYSKVYEKDMDGVTVRVWKPKTMGKLPTYAMLEVLETYAKDAAALAYYNEKRKVQWILGNPDYGAWDAMVVRRLDSRKMTLDIYFTALLIRPFSKQAYDRYNEFPLTFDVVTRLAMMWDSREFDRERGYDTSFGAFSDHLYSYKQVGAFACITDKSFDAEDEYDDDEQVERRRCVKFRVNDNEIIYNAIMGKDEALRDGGTELMHACAKSFCDLRKEHPEVTEMHFYTDEEVG